MKKNILFLIIHFFLLSCVGTVEDLNPQSTKNVTAGSVDVPFTGITEAIAVSNDKVEVYFYPAQGNSFDMTYQIYVNGSTTPIEVKGDSLFLNNYGQYVYTVSDLRVNTTYSFSVGFSNSSEGTKSTANNSLSVQTFSNYTADFSGITKVYTSSGDLGREQVVVEWIPAFSLGSTYAPKPNDPVAYEVRYISAENGSPTDLRNINNPFVVSSTEPSTISSNPQLSTERKRTISGLSSSQKYYFMVRAIHKSYIDYSEDESSYKKETNNKVLSVTTLSSSGVFDWDNGSVTYEKPLGDDALTKIDLTWTGATGPYYGYRAYVVKVGEPSDSLATAEGSLINLDSDKITELNASVENFSTITPDQNSIRIEGLISYSYYKATVVACLTIDCGDGSRLIGNEVLFRVVPDLAPFSGVLEIKDPIDITALDEIEITFDSPVTSAGYVNGFEVYCFSDENDTSPVELVYNVASTSTKDNCNGLTRITNATSSFDDLEGIKIRGNFFSGTDVLSDKTYCFGAIPIITSDHYTKRDLSNIVIKCETLEIKVPTKEDFSGASTACNANTDSLLVSWQAPTDGLYDRYEVFWKESDGTAFSFASAIAGAYNSTDDLSSTNYTIANLNPGKSYQYAVLSYIAGTTKKYSEANASIRSCQVPLPVPTFVEWVDIFSVGPKGDGLVPERDNGSNANEKVYLFETLNDFGQPLEVDVTDYFNGDYSPSSTFDTDFGSISNSAEHPGTFGKKAGDTDITYMYQYSNSGIIRLAWKDITFNSGTKTMSDFITDYESTSVKKDRKYGYKILRSDDDQKNWTELTSSNYSFQTSSNSGLLHTVDYKEYERPNDATISNFDAVIFTDYSVKHAGVSGNVARARVYHYKIIPVFDGKELRFEKEDSNPQHIIKVILPPENMALVHRLIANRQTCMEIGQPINADISSHYTCSWDGIGARGLNVPWVPGSTVYDFGSDMLIDRYELGCNFTRGDYTNQHSKFNASASDFLGASDSSSTFKGCLIKNASLAQVDGGSAPADGSTYSDFYDYRVGDCIGESVTDISAGSGICSDNTKTVMHSILLPGLNSSNSLRLCENSDNLLDNYSDTYNSPLNKFSSQVAQSEYGAVYYNRAYKRTNRTYTSTSLRAGGADTTNPHRLAFSSSRGVYPSRCMINIPVSNNTVDATRGNGRLKQRWIPANMLNDLVYDGNTVNKVSLIDKTMTEVEALSEMFDVGLNAVPSQTYRDNSALLRYDSSNTPIGKIVSSNDSKLPPLNGLDQESANLFCSTYEVEVGTFDDDQDSFSVQESATSKRLMRRTEGIVAAAHPRQLNEDKIIALEKGSYNTIAGVDDEDFYKTGCNSFDRGISSGQTSSTIHAGEPISVRSPDQQSISNGSTSGSLLLTGSSYFDHEGQTLSSQSCISRYGLQDIVGNIEEYSSEKAFCNYSGEALKIGTSDQSADSIDYGSGTYFNDNALETWVQSSPDTGRCSTVEVGSARSNAFSSGSYLYPMYDLFGTLNSSMITSSNDLDQKSISYVRNGDGYFLDYGQDNLAPPLSVNDTLALVYESPVTSRNGSTLADPRRGKYFSPISGVPLECGNGICSTTTDNMSISTTSLRDKFSLDAGSFSIPNYPIGNSMIISDGMSEISKSSVASINSSNTYVYSVTYMNDVMGVGGTFATNDTTDNLDIEVSASWWRVDRSSAIYSLNFGGKSSDNRPGRYSGRFLGKNTTNQKGSSDSGVRCVVRINEGNP